MSIKWRESLGPIAEDSALQDAFVLLRDAMRKSNVAAIARAVLLRKMRTVLRAHSNGLIATALNFDYEVRSSAKAFDEIPKLKMEGEMLDLAKHIIACVVRPHTLRSSFANPSSSVCEPT
ncbi:hypothetical protein ISN39_12490 [Rhizobium sp. 007]|nr:hypothetical protein ISN39_12490 [Rhizobium sp. 007]